MTESLSAEFIATADNILRDLKRTRVFSSFEDRAFSDTQLVQGNQALHRKIDDLINRAHEASLIDRNTLVETGQWIGADAIITIGQSGATKGVLVSTYRLENNSSFFGKECHRHFKGAVQIVRAAIHKGPSGQTEEATPLAGADLTL